MLHSSSFTWSWDGLASVRWSESPLTAGQGLRSCHSTLASVSKDLPSKRSPTSSNFNLKSQVDSLFGQEFPLTPSHPIMWGNRSQSHPLEVISKGWLVRLIEQSWEEAKQFPGGLGAPSPGDMGNLV